MACTSIPVDILNPGQVFACLGLLELLDLHCDDARGRFDWSDSNHVTFHICSDGNVNPLRVVLDFLASAQIEALVPTDYKCRSLNAAWTIITTDSFPGTSVDDKTLPIRLTDREREIYFDMTSWCPARGREFKLFSGQQRSYQIVDSMLNAIKDLWKPGDETPPRDPFGVLTPLRGSSFKLDARKSWTAIDTGYSPDEENHLVESSPLVELLAAVGLEYARPGEANQDGESAAAPGFVYAIWSAFLPPVLARPALGGVNVGCPQRFFRFTLDKAGQNKVVTFAEEVTSP